MNKKLIVLFANKIFVKKQQQIFEKNKKQIKKMIDKKNEIRLMFEKILQTLMRKNFDFRLMKNV